jgi:hypothetical protein
MTVYRQAAEVATIGRRLVAQHHTDLVDAEIRYVFRDEHQTTGGKAVMGKARLVSGLNAWLAASVDPEAVMPADDEEPDRFFVIEIAEDIWRVLTADDREALVDHELCHCILEANAEGDPKPKLRAHDLEEFVAVVGRHGIWRPEIEALLRAAERGGQLLLNVEASEP